MCEDDKAWFIIACRHRFMANVQYTTVLNHCISLYSYIQREWMQTLVSTYMHKHIAPPLAPIM